MNKILILLLCIPVFAAAQSETDIRSHYQEVNKQIAESKEHGMEGPLYCNEWVTNKHDRSWPAVGIFHETTDFWYDDDPNHLSPEERNPIIVLLKVTITRKSAELTTNEEYLYQNGSLVFYYCDEGEEGREWETRIYFNAKGMFKSSVKANNKELTAKDFTLDEFKDFKPQPANILKEGKHYQDLFVKSMVYP